jgi:hypothetical protein
MDCYACSNEASRQCRRCSRVYCEVHGGDLCAECLSPTSALPSFNLYRGSLLALLVGTAIAIWLLVRPPGAGDSPGVIITDLGTPSPIVTEVVDTPLPEPTATIDLDATNDDDTPTPEATATDQPTDTPEPQQVGEYIVQSGDTLIGIAERFAPLGVDPFEYAQDIATASGLSSINDLINTGDILVLP